MIRLAVLSDIHGNLPALEAVLADIDRQGRPDFYWVLGDLVAFCPWPGETLARLRSLPNVSFLQGNTDRYLVTGRRPLAPVRSPEDWAQMPAFLERRDALFRWTVAQLTWEEYQFLRDLPTRLEMDLPEYGRVAAVHAVPGDDEANIFPDTPDEEILPYLSGLEARLLVYGHTHRPLDRWVGGVRLVNGGSIGLPLDGDPRAGYALLDFNGPECTVDLRRVAYDGESVIAEWERVEHPARRWLASILRRAAIVA